MMPNDVLEDKNKMQLNQPIYKIHLQKLTCLISMQASLTDAVITFTIPNLITVAITHISLNWNCKVN
jgi:hypothetical protein